MVPSTFCWFCRFSFNLPSAFLLGFKSCLPACLSPSSFGAVLGNQTQGFAHTRVCSSTELHPQPDLRASLKFILSLKERLSHAL